MQSYARTVSDLASLACRCGKAKDHKRFFCRACYWKLPEAYRVRLWRKYGSQRKVCAIYSSCLAFLGLVEGPEGRAA